MATHQLRTVDDPAPCEKCLRREHCAKGYACERFVVWVDKGKVLSETSMTPKRNLYLEMFGDE